MASRPPPTGPSTMTTSDRTERASERLDQFIANPRRSLWTLSLPIMIGMSIYTAYMIADMVFVGMLGPQALTAVAFNMPLLFLAMGTTFGLGTAVTALIAQAIGQPLDYRCHRAVTGRRIIPTVKSR